LQQDDAVAAAQNDLSIAQNRFKLGLDPYLNVITAQTALFTNQQTAVDLRIQAMNSNVQLIEALGGGWNTTQLPAPATMTAKIPPPAPGQPPTPPPAQPPPAPAP